MLKDNWNPVVDTVVGAMIRRGLRGQFRAIRVCGLEHLRTLDTTKGTLAVANHTNWWDGFLAHFLTAKLLRGWRFNVAQEERILREYPFFTWAGAFGLDLENGAVAGLRHAIRKAGCPRTILWFFPQGRIHYAGTPIAGRRGAAFLAENARVQILPVNFRYEWLVESRPTILARFGAPLTPGTDQKGIDTAMQSLHDATGRCLDPIHLEGYEAVMRPRLSLNKRWEWLLAAARGRLGEFEKDNEQ